MQQSSTGIKIETTNATMDHHHHYHHHHHHYAGVNLFFGPRINAGISGYHGAG